MAERKSKAKDKKEAPKTKESSGRKESKKEIIEDVKKIEENIEAEEKSEEKHEKPSKEQLKSENKMMAIFIGVLLLISAVLIIYFLVSNNAKTFTYDNVPYNIIQQGKITFYHTTLPIIYNGTHTYYNLYLRNNPRDLAKEVPFNGNLYIKKNMAINYSADITCDGDGTIAIANFLNLYGVIGTKVVRDPNATCDPQQRYVYVNIKVANETSIQETAPACYTINVANCQILQATERYMTETLSAVHKYLNSSA